MKDFDLATVFTSQKDAIAFLNAQGFKISKSKFSADYRKGLIPCASDKSFCASDLVEYAQSGLKAPTPFKLEKDEQTQRINAVHQELKGLATGIVIDGKVVHQEAEFLLQWLNSNAELAEQIPAVKRLHKRAEAMLEDGELCKKEGKKLLDIIHRLILPDLPKTVVFETPIETEKQAQSTLHGVDPYQSNKALKLISPRTDIFDKVDELDSFHRFCFTGIFAFGDRNACQDEMIKRGVDVGRAIIKSGCTLVVGSIASPDWVHGNYGRKIEKALQYRDEGGSIKIIHEDTWASIICKD